MPNVNLIVLGNKSDNEANRKVDKAEAEAYCKTKGLKVIEVSAKSGEHVSQAFQ